MRHGRLGRGEAVCGGGGARDLHLGGCDVVCAVGAGREVQRLCRLRGVLVGGEGAEWRALEDLRGLGAFPERLCGDGVVVGRSVVVHCGESGWRGRLDGVPPIHCVSVGSAANKFAERLATSRRLYAVRPLLGANSANKGEAGADKERTCCFPCGS